MLTRALLRKGLLAVAAMCGVLPLGVVSAQTPTATPTAETVTATPPETATPTATPSPTPPPTPTPDPNHPLGLRFAPAGGAPPGSFAYPNLEGGATYEGLPTVLRYAPLAGTLAPEDAQRFTIGIAEATAAGQAFQAAVRYNSEATAEFISVFSWTKSGDFEYVAPCCSPVSVARQTTIHGLPALTEVPSDAVVGGIGPVRVFFLHNGVIYFLDFSATPREQALAISERAAAWIVSRPPGPPATGTGVTPEPSTELRGAGAVAGAMLIVVLATMWCLDRTRRGGRKL